MKYAYEISGTAARGQTWSVKGEVEAIPAMFVITVNEALRETFQALTDGKAVYGRPGVGCIGPYSITRMLIEARNGDGDNREARQPVVSAGDRGA